MIVGLIRAKLNEWLCFYLNRESQAGDKGPAKSGSSGGISNADAEDDEEESDNSCLSPEPPGASLGGPLGSTLGGSLANLGQTNPGDLHTAVSEFVQGVQGHTAQDTLKMLQGFSHYHQAHTQQYTKVCIIENCFYKQENSLVDSRSHHVHLFVWLPRNILW